MLRHLGSLTSEHPGQNLVRSISDSFEVEGKAGTHVCLVFETLGLSLADIRELAGGKLPENLLKGLVYGLLLGLDYLHTVAHVVHTGMCCARAHFKARTGRHSIDIVETDRIC